MSADEWIMMIWRHVQKNNQEVFETDREKIFLAMKIAAQCNDISYKDGYLAMEEFVDAGCGMEQEEAPLWEYLRPAMRIVIDVSFLMDLDKAESKKMMSGMFLANEYTGYQAVQGCIYLIGMSMVLDKVQADKALDFFRSLIPDEAQEDFDHYFQSALEQWRV